MSSNLFAFENNGMNSDPATGQADALRSRRGVAPASHSWIRCRVMGRLAVTADGGLVRLPGLAGRLVAFLAVQGPVTTDEVIDVFWRDDNPELSLARLRKVVWRVRRQCEGLVDRQFGCLSLGRAVEVDADRFTAAADDALHLAGAGLPAADAARDALGRYGGELLPAFRYEDWTDSPRAALRHRYVALLDLMAADAAANRSPDRAVVYLERAIASEPYDEGRYVRGAELLLQAGRRAPALLLLERGLAVLEELGLPPSPTTVETAQRLRAG
jgi:DNA-binding SARP family transcriptional activator